MKKFSASIILISTLVLTSIIGFQNCSSNKNNSIRSAFDIRPKKSTQKLSMNSNSANEISVTNSLIKAAHIKALDETQTLSATTTLIQESCYYGLSHPDSGYSQFIECEVDVTNTGTATVRISYKVLAFDEIEGLSEATEEKEVALGATQRITTAKIVDNVSSQPISIPIIIDPNGLNYISSVNANHPSIESIRPPNITGYTRPENANQPVRFTVAPYTIGDSDPLLGQFRGVIYRAYCHTEGIIFNFATELIEGNSTTVELTGTVASPLFRSCTTQIRVFADVVFENGDLYFPEVVFPATNEATEILEIYKFELFSFLNLQENQFLYQQYHTAAGGTLSGDQIGVRVSLTNYTVAQKNALQVCFHSSAVPQNTDHCKLVSELYAENDPNSYSFNGYPKDLGVPPGLTKVFLHNTASGRSVIKEFESVDEFFHVALTDSSNQPFSSNSTNTITPSDTISFYLAGKNSNGNFSFCKELLDETTECTDSAFTTLDNNLLFRCGNDETSGARFCSYVDASLGRLQFEAGKTYQVNIKNNSTRFPSIVTYTFEVSLPVQLQDPTFSCSPLVVECGQTLICEAGSNDEIELQGCNRAATPNCRERLTQDPNFEPGSPFQWVREQAPNNDKYRFSFPNNTATHNTIDDAVNTFYVKDSRGRESPDVTVRIKGCAPRP